MTQTTVILFGRSGSGKGTQAKLLRDYFAANDGTRGALYIETGTQIREFMARDHHTSRLVKDVIDRGGLLPEFVPIWVWTDYLIEHFSGREHLILDGLSRRPNEAPILDAALRFFGVPSPHVVLLSVSKEWAVRHLLERGRRDDTEAEILRRLEWYDTNVAPTIEFFKKDPSYYRFHEIHGERDIEDVHRDIVAGFAA